MITISGDIGSGKSAVGRLVCEQLNFEFFSTGGIQRAIADERGMSTLDLNAYSETHPDVDHDIDAFSAELGRKRDAFLLDSRLAWHFIPHALKVYLCVPARVAAERVLKDTQRTGERYANLEEAEQSIRARRASEMKRFQQLYNIDCGDYDNYDVVIDTSAALQPVIADTLLEVYRAWQAGETLPSDVLRPSQTTEARHD
jgi:CMP/dCMP kinase